MSSLYIDFSDQDETRWRVRIDYRSLDYINTYTVNVNVKAKDSNEALVVAEMWFLYSGKSGLITSSTIIE